MASGAGAIAKAIPNQIFIGLPWKTVRAKYERVVPKLKVSFPLSYVIVMPNIFAP